MMSIAFEPKPFPTHLDLPCSDKEIVRELRQLVEAERQRAEAEKRKAENLAAKLRELGIEPDQV